MCYKCGLPSHIKCDCKQRTAAEARQLSKHDSAAVCELISDRDHRRPDKCQHLVEDQGSLQMKCGCELPYAGCLMVGPKAGVPEKRLEVVQGQIGDYIVSC